FHASTTVKMPMVVSASVSCVSIRSWIASPCSMTSSACSPASMATHPPITPAHSVHSAAALSDSRFVSQAPMSNSTVTSSSAAGRSFTRSEEHTSELQSRENLVCRLLLEKKKVIYFTEILQNNNI